MDIGLSKSGNTPRPYCLSIPEQSYVFALPLPSDGHAGCPVHHSEKSLQKAPRFICGQSLDSLVNNADIQDKGHDDVSSSEKGKRPVKKSKRATVQSITCRTSKLMLRHPASVAAQNGASDCKRQHSSGPGVQYFMYNSTLIVMTANRSFRARSCRYIWCDIRRHSESD